MKKILWTLTILLICVMAIDVYQASVVQQQKELIKGLYQHQCN